MPSRSSKKKRLPDPNVMAFQIVQGITTGELPSETQPGGKNPAAVALGKLGGAKGGKARARKLSAKKRKAIATKAAKTRWKNVAEKKRDRLLPSGL